MADLPTTISYTDIAYESQLDSSKMNTDIGNAYDAINGVIAWGEDIEDDVGSNSDLIAGLAQGVKVGVKTRWASDTTITLDHTSLGATNGTSWSVFGGPTSPITVTLATADGTVNKLDTGSIAADTWYAVYSIWKADKTGAAGILSTGATTPTLSGITGYGGGYYRRVGWVRSNSASKITPFTKTGVFWRIIPSEIAASTAQETFHYIITSANMTIEMPSTDTWYELTSSCQPPGIDTISIAPVSGTTFDFRPSGSALGTGAGDSDTYHNQYFSATASPLLQTFITLDTDGKFDCARTGAVTSLRMNAWVDDF